MRPSAFVYEERERRDAALGSFSGTPFDADAQVYRLTPTPTGSSGYSSAWTRFFCSSMRTFASSSMPVGVILESHRSETVAGRPSSRQGFRSALFNVEGRLSSTRGRALCSQRGSRWRLGSVGSMGRNRVRPPQPGGVMKITRFFESPSSSPLRVQHRDQRPMSPRSKRRLIARSNFTRSRFETRTFPDFSLPTPIPVVYSNAPRARTERSGTILGCFHARRRCCSRCPIRPRRSRFR